MCLLLLQFAVPVEETKYACTFLPLPRVKQKHHIYKVNWGKNRTEQTCSFNYACKSVPYSIFSINLGAFHVSFTAIGMSQLICLDCVKIFSASFLTLKLSLSLCTSRLKKSSYKSDSLSVMNSGQVTYQYL